MSAFATVLGLSGLAISLGAKDTIPDAIAGLIKPVDALPGRVGDGGAGLPGLPWGNGNVREGMKGEQLGRRG